MKCASNTLMNKISMKIFIVYKVILLKVLQELRKSKIFLYILINSLVVEQSMVYDRLSIPNKKYYAKSKYKY